MTAVRSPSIPVRHFLLVYDRRAGRLVEQREFADASEAAEAYASLEVVHRGVPNMEVVLLGADSLETLKQTHGHYFSTAGREEGPLTDFTAVIGEAISLAKPGSPRHHVLGTILEMAKRAAEITTMNRTGASPLEMLNVMLNVRDLAREEQQWAQNMALEFAGDADSRDALRFYRVHLAQIEASSNHSIAYVGSDREESEEASWWAEWAGQLVMRTLALAPQLMVLSG